MPMDRCMGGGEAADMSMSPSSSSESSRSWYLDGILCYANNCYLCQVRVRSHSFYSSDPRGPCSATRALASVYVPKNGGCELEYNLEYKISKSHASRELRG
jgi:hypothetical protein